MQLKHKILITIIALGGTILSIAQENSKPSGRGPGPGGQRRPPPVALLGALDANHDGVIDATEIASASEALKSLDKNGDGVLTPDELMGPRPTATGADASFGGQGAPPPADPGNDQGPRPSEGRHRPPPIAVVGALDANHDGVVDADEITNASVALKKLDKNGDGRLTPDELIGPRPMGPRPGVGGPPDGQGDSFRRPRGPGAAGNDGADHPAPPPEQ